jgi:hypothetical protein
MNAIKKHETTQRPKPVRRFRVEDYDPTLDMSDLQDDNEELKADNPLLRKLVAQLSLEKLKAEMGP